MRFLKRWLIALALVIAMFAAVIGVVFVGNQLFVWLDLSDGAKFGLIITAISVGMATCIALGP